MDDINPTESLAWLSVAQLSARQMPELLSTTGALMEHATPVHTRFKQK